jgi:hypothetical protein
MKVYKYKPFNTYTADLLTDSDLYFSDPASFNDPLEVEWNIVQDLDLLGAIEVLTKLNEKTRRIDNIEFWLNDRRQTAEYGTESDIEEGELEACDCGRAVTARFESQVLMQIKADLSETILDYGVLSLSGRWDSPLMWSHYADAHRGICIEYTCDEEMDPKPQTVHYDRPKQVGLSDIRRAIVESSQSAVDLIINTCYFTKAKDWGYEEEIRLLGPRGGRRGEYYMKNTAVYFGSRCPKSTITMIACTLNQRSSPPSFHEVFFDARSMTMQYRDFDDEAFNHYRASDGFPFPPIND